VVDLIWTCKWECGFGAGEGFGRAGSFSSFLVCFGPLLSFFLF
jgi:hypothetical protein